MKKTMTVMAMTAALSMSALAPALADGHTPVVSDEAADQACFGQWRASYDDDAPLGSILSERAGYNAEKTMMDMQECGAANR